MNWGEMKKLATSFVHRKDMDWDMLQLLALDEINQSLTVQENEGVGSVVMAPSSINAAYSGPLPADFMRPRAVFFGSRELEPTDVQGLLARGAITGFFAISGKNLFANSNGPLSVVYSTRLAALVADADQNELSLHYSPVLLYGLLCQAAQLIQDFEALSKYRDAFDAVVGTANANYVQAVFTAGAVVRSPYGRVSN